MMSKPTIQFKDETKRLDRAVDVSVKNSLTRVGGAIRDEAKDSIRRRPGVSRPGEPPHSHLGTLQALIASAYDAQHSQVVVGPGLLTSRPARSRLLSRSTVPETLEFGGVVEIQNTSGSVRVKEIQPRPFMGPAFRAVMRSGKLQRYWQRV